MSVVDSATRYLWLVPLRNKTAEAVANALYEDVIARTSVPSGILTDLGKEFTAEILDRLYARLGITRLVRPGITHNAIVSASVYIVPCTTCSLSSSNATLSVGQPISLGYV